MRVSIQEKTTLALIMLVILGLVIQSSPSAKAAEADPPSQWVETAAAINRSSHDALCVDALQPDTLLTSDATLGNGTTAVNWKTGATTKLADRYFYYCNEASGYMYAYTDGTSKAIRYSSSNPGGTMLAHAPNYFGFGRDGSLQVYALAATNDAPQLTKLYSSSDAGTTWQERGQQFNGKLWQLAVAGADAQALYGLVSNETEASTTYTLYFSANAGASWEKRWERAVAKGFLPPTPVLATPGGRYAPVNLVQLNTSQGAGSNGSTTVEISVDGGRTFRDVGVNGRSGYSQLFYTPEGLLHLRKSEPGSYSLAFSADGAKTWQPRTLPFNVPASQFGPGLRIEMQQSLNVPANLFYYGVDFGEIWHSADSGKTWRNLGAVKSNMRVSSYAPTQLLGFDEASHKVYTYDLSKTDATQTQAAPASGALASDYYPETRHNLSGVFKKYWLENGGLAQFGYPKTEMFREYNPADGKVYLVQYFERNRFEYHPDYAGTKYEVLLGLLGNQLTDQYRATGHGAFNHFENMHYPNGLYFAETSHNLRNSFREYWEKNGGLALYGYPISEELSEVNPDDGKTYVVQYFERNRFEWHPENKGTKYEVLLGLLGNSLLREKGWL